VSTRDQIISEFHNLACTLKMHAVRFETINSSPERRNDAVVLRKAAEVFEARAAEAQR
jgi:hypothetical protein